MSFQQIINNCSSLTLDNRRLTAITTTRSGLTRTVDRGPQPWILTVEFPTGPRWEDYRQIVAVAQKSGRNTEEQITFSGTGQEYIFGYQGDYVGTHQATWNQGQAVVNLNITSNINPGEYWFRAGDILNVKQGGSAVYQVTEDVPEGSTAVPVHRPILEDTQATPVNLLVGSACKFSVKCVQFPNPVIFSHKQFGFDGPFVFAEVY